MPLFRQLSSLEEGDISEGLDLTYWAENRPNLFQPLLDFEYEACKPDPDGKIPRHYAISPGNLPSFSYPKAQSLFTTKLSLVGHHSS